MTDGVNLPAQGTGDTTPKVSTQKVTADTSDVQDVSLTAVVGGVRTRNPTIPVSAVSLPLPTGAALDATLTANGVLAGAVNETAPASDTASSGANGRLQRVAQRLTSLIALLPTSLGQKTSAASLAVVVASDQTVIPVSDNAGSLTVDAPVGTPLFARLSDGTAALTTTSGRLSVDPSGVTSPVSLASVPSHAVTNAGTFATQDSQKVADNAAFTDGTTPVQPAGYIFDEVAGTALTENDAAAARIDAKRAQVGVVEDATTRGQRLAVSAAGAAKVDGSAVTQPVSAASLPLPTGAALDATLTGGTQKSKLVDTGGTNVASISAGGALKVDGSAVTQPVSGTISVSGTMPVSVAIGQEVDGHSANIGLLADASSANTLTGLLKNIKAALAGTLTISGAVSQAPATSGGYTISRTLAAASTNAANIKASAGQLFGWYLQNTAAYPVYLKFYNTAGTPTAGAGTPVLTIGIPAGAAANTEFLGGIAFGTGIGITITKLVADADATVLVANDLIANLFYK